MGLDVSLGILASVSPESDPEGVEWTHANFREVNRVLLANGLPQHAEPEVLPDLPYRGQVLSFPYSWLHYLRRAVAYARQAPDRFRPVENHEDPTADEVLDRELSVYLDSHLICHSDCEGYYVPLDFAEPLYDDQEPGLPGGILGSSQRAFREVIDTAPLLGIQLSEGILTDDIVKVLTTDSDTPHPYWIERIVWLTMYEAFRLSLEYKCAVCFR